MAEEAVAVGAGAAAGTGSGSGGGAPAGGAGGGAPAAPAAPAAPQTDEQILGIDPVGAAPAEEQAPVQQTEQEKAAAAAAAQKTPEQQAADAARATEEAKAIPQKWQDLAKTDPEFRTLVVTAKANAEKLATMEPKFNELQTAVAAVDRADQAYLSGDPAAIQSELRTFIAEKPEAIEPMLEAGLNLLKETNPQGYEQRLTKLTQETLRGWQFDKAFQVFRNALNRGDEGMPTIKAQVEALLKFADENGFPTTEAAQVAQRAQELDQREASARQADERNYNESTRAFSNTVKDEIAKTLKSEIKAGVDKFLEKSAFPDGAKTRIAADVLTELNAMLAANKDMLDQVGKAIWPNGSKDAQGKIIRGAFNDANRAMAIKLPVDYAKSVLNDALKKVVEQYTKDFVASTDAAGKRADAAASKTEVSGGAPAPRGNRPLTKKDVDYSKMSDEQILGA